MKYSLCTKYSEYLSVDLLLMLFIFIYPNKLCIFSHVCAWKQFDMFTHISDFRSVTEYTTEHRIALQMSDRLRAILVTRVIFPWWKYTLKSETENQQTESIPFTSVLFCCYYFFWFIWCTFTFVGDRKRVFLWQKIKRN